MQDFTEDNLTQVVCEEYGSKTSDERLRTVVTSLIQHLHAFIKDVELTEAEWYKAVEFLTATGQVCNEERQEFVLLSDVLGVSMLVDAINNRRSGLGTENTVLGPFHVTGAPELPMGANIMLKDIGGTPAFVRGRITDQDGAPLEGAVLDVWQASLRGFYDVQDPEVPQWNLRGKFTTGADGRYWFATELPGPYPIPTDGPVGELLRACGRHPMRPGHLHFIITAEGHDRLTTHIFTAGDEYLESDSVFGTKSSLVGEYETCHDEEMAKKYGLSVPFQMLDFDFGLMRSAAAEPFAA